MPIARFQMEDGRIARFEVPEGTTPEQAQSMMQEHFAPQQAQAKSQPEPSAWDKIKRSAGLTARAGIEGAGDIVGIVQNPMAAMTGGAIRRSSEVYPELATSMGLPQPETSSERVAGAGVRGLVGAGSMIGVGGQLARVPGMIGQFGSSLAAAPMAQATSGALGGGSAQTAQEMGAGAGGQLAAGVAGAFSPTLAARALPAIGGRVADVVGGLGTHTGGESLRQAARAGLKGGDIQKSFTENMRGNIPMDDVLNTAKSNLQNMGAQRAAAYRKDMAGISGDKTILDFDDIDNALENAISTVKVKGAAGNRMVSPETSVWVDKFGQQVEVPEILKQPQQRNILDELKKAGGININELHDMNLTAADMKRYPGLFTKNGKSMDAITEHIQQKGWLGQSDIDNADLNLTGGGHEISRDMITGALENPRYIVHPSEADAAMAYHAAEKSIQDIGANKVTIPAKYEATSGEHWTVGKDEQGKIKEVADIIQEWRHSPDLHTVEGLDALKRRVGAVYPENPKMAQSQRVIDTMYNSVKKTIEKQAPVYSKVMKDYSDASDQIREIERALSLGNKASKDTAMRKLQSLMRNNVNTNYGNRLDLAQSLEQQGGNEILSALAGQSLSSLTPRGLGGAVGAGLGMGGYAMGGPALAVPTLLAQSPRLMGEAALKLGQTGRSLSSLANPDFQAAMRQSALYGSMGANQ